MRKTHRNLLVAAATIGFIVLSLWLNLGSSRAGTVHASLPVRTDDAAQDEAVSTWAETRLVPLPDAPLSPGIGIAVATDAGNIPARITGRITSGDPTLDMTRVRVAATPVRDMLTVHFMCEDQVVQPEKYGWVIESCDAQGHFVLEEGLDPDTRYLVTAAGHGVVSLPDGKNTFGAGDELTLPVEPLFGLEVLFVNEQQLTWEWPDHSEPPCWIHLHHRTPGRGQPSPIALALHRLPARTKGTGMARAYSVGDFDPSVTIYANPPNDQPSVRLPERLKPVRNGLRRIKKVIPGAGTASPPVTVEIPEGLLDLMLGTEDSLSIQWMIEFSQKGLRRSFGFRPRFERGTNTWTTTSLPPGKYTARFHITINLLAGLSVDPDAPGFHAHQKIEIGEHGTTLHMPNVSYGTVQLTELDAYTGGRAAVVHTTITGKATGGRRHYAKFKGPPYRIPILWDPAKHPEPTWGIKLYVPTGHSGPMNNGVALAGENGSTVIRLRHGENVRVALQPAEHGTPDPSPGPVIR